MCVVNIHSIHFIIIQQGEQNKLVIGILIKLQQVLCDNSKYCCGYIRGLTIWESRSNSSFFGHYTSSSIVHLTKEGKSISKNIGTSE